LKVNIRRLFTALPSVVRYGCICTVRHVLCPRVRACPPHRPCGL